MISICIFICKTLQSAPSRSYLKIVLSWKMMFSRNSSSHRRVVDESAFVARARFQIACIRCRFDWCYAPTIAIHPLIQNGRYVFFAYWIVDCLNMVVFVLRIECQPQIPVFDRFFSEFRIYFRNSRNHVKFYEKENTYKLIKVTMHSSFVQASHEQAHMEELSLTIEHSGCAGLVYWLRLASFSKLSKNVRTSQISEIFYRKPIDVVLGLGLELNAVETLRERCIKM